MRVIAGQAKGTKLTSLKGARVRPTLDRVRESLFSMLGHDLSGKSILDWFAGSGAIGIEALSRGARKVVFVEHNRQAQKLIYSNLEKCRFWSGERESKETDWILLKMDALHAVSLLEERGYRFDIVYVDPPFAEGQYTECLTVLAASRLLEDSAKVVVEHHHKNVLHESYGKLSLTDQRKLGDTCLSFYKLQGF